MKRVLITGANSYIGVSVEKWLNQWKDEYEVNTLDMQKEDWREYDFSKYDSIFHVAGIAHADVGKVSEDRKQLYYKVNCDLAKETAVKAKRAGVRQFIYMSSIIVYGDNQSIRRLCVITNHTPLSPANFYGDSKVQAEKKLEQLKTEQFKIAIIRPPMIYGKGGKGNYSLISKLAQKMPIFPKVKNQRSMLHIDNLCELVRMIIEHEESGVFMPQNKEYVETSEMVKLIAKAHGKRPVLIPGFSWGIKLLSIIPGRIGNLTNKAFGNLVYDKELSMYYKGRYQIRGLEESIILTEREE